MRRHLRVGWWSLLGFLILGFVLEVLHGFKTGLYLDVSNETRRLMWTLAHAHGALLGLVHVLYALCLRLLPGVAAGSQRLVSSSLIGASVLLPGGFFLGGVGFYAGDPGLGILAAPVGATLLIIAVYLIARAAASPDSRPEPPGGEGRRGKKR
ncbi:MAG: hypothetical protein QF681_04270 [Vicinamibacterales bacterium]|nr:hypothetical protein [Vicinamibacterales bacterium]